MDIELIAGPLTIWWGPVGTAFPTTSAAVAGNWTLLGGSGTHNYDEDGVTVMHNQSVEYWRGSGSPYPRKAFTPEADIMVSVMVRDFRLAQLRLALNQNTVTVGAAESFIDLDIGLEPNEVALLVRGIGKSPEFAGGNLQYELRRCVEEGSREWAFPKATPAGSELMFRSIYDIGQPYPAGRVVAQNS